jgi:4-alpha-glucanotransferase
VLEPVAVRSGRPRRAPALPAEAGGRLEVNIVLESGGEMRTEHDLGALRSNGSSTSTAPCSSSERIALPGDLPVGYHQLRASGRGVSAAAHLLVAPDRAYRGPGELRSWGVFAPVYALRSAGQLGIGDLGDLAALCRLVGAHGGSLVGTLPLLACFYGEPFQPEPLLAGVAPQLERDPRRPPAGGMERPRAARHPAADRPHLRQAGELLAGEPLIDYRRVGVLKRAALDRLTAEVWADQAARARLEEWAASRPGWRNTPASARSPRRSGGRGACGRRHSATARSPRGTTPRRHAALTCSASSPPPRSSADIKSGRDSAGLYLDLPVGVDGRGYDLWRERASFAAEMSVGAPPDPLARSGQNWAVPPLHPVRQRETATATSSTACGPTWSTPR